MSAQGAPRVLVVGAGAAGLIAAWRAAGLGASVTVLERNVRSGTKILISGGGKCNITHAGNVEDLLRAFRPNEARFLRPGFYRFPNAGVLALLAERGVETVTREDARVFPASASARDVTRALEGAALDAGAAIRLGQEAAGLVIEGGAVRGVRTQDGAVPADRVIVAVGGSSYPGTGCRGDGFAWAREVGHTVTPVRAALAPIFLDPRPPERWAGVALRDVLVHLRCGGRRSARRRGDALFTHRGLSGPAILEISREAAELRERGAIVLELDLLPDCAEEAFSERLRAWAGANPNRRIFRLVEDLVPKRLAPALMAAAGVSEEAVGSRLTRGERVALVRVLKGWSPGRVAQIPLEKGEVVAGGVALDEVDPKTMASRLVRGLYWAGEVLDVAGPVGGYNLQAAFSTGFLAGESAAQGGFGA